MGCGGDQVGGDHGQSGVGIYVTAAPFYPPTILRPHDWKLITGEGEHWPEGIERGRGGGGRVLLVLKSMFCHQSLAMIFVLIRYDKI